ncbi:MAG TPA: aldo/keto reductase [Candidatus Nanopelagicaceae bacterium]
MITIPLTNLSVHPLCLGGNVFGWSADETESHAVLNAYARHGGNFVDTADVYSEWKEGHIGGESETIIGNWMKARCNRDAMVIGTKIGKLSTRPGLSSANIIAACEDSLRRLQSDHIDIYYSHYDDEETPLAETLEAFTKLIAQGKVRYIASSSYAPERLEEALRISKENNLAPYIAVQDQYNLVYRKDFENGSAKILRENGMSIIPFFGLARGFLTGKYRPGVTVNSLRAKGVADYQNERGWSAVALLETIAAAHNSSISSIALAWLRAQPTVSVPIASARTVEQLEEIVQVVELTTDEISQLSAITA